jgi:hypothetical protein
MSISYREIEESPQPQGVNEKIAYLLTTTEWGSSPTDVVVSLYDQDGFIDVSATKLLGSASVAGDVITTPLVIDLVEGHHYWIGVRFTVNGNTFEPFGIIVGER